MKVTAGRDVVVIGNTFRKVQFGGLIHASGFDGPGTSSGATNIGIAVESYVGPREGGLVSANLLAQDARQWPGFSLIGALALDGCTIGSNTLAGDVPLVGVALQGATGCAVVANKDKRKAVSPDDTATTAGDRRVSGTRPRGGAGVDPTGCAS